MGSPTVVSHRSWAVFSVGGLGVVIRGGGGGGASCGGGVMETHVSPFFVFLYLDRERASWRTFGGIVVLRCLHFRNLRGGTRLCRIQEDNRSTWRGIVVSRSVVKNR